MNTGRVSWLMFGAACVSVAIEAASNALFAYELGGLVKATVYGLPLYVDGALLAAGSVAIAVFQAHAATEVIHRPPGARIGAAVVILAACLCYSTGAMTAHLLALQQRSFDKVAAERAKYDGAAREYQATRAARDRAEQEYTRAIGELARLGSPRAGTAIQAEIADARISPAVLRETNQCTERLDVARLREACEPLRKLYRERGDATRHAETMATAGEAKTALAERERELAAAVAALKEIPEPAAPWAARLWLAAGLPWIFAAVIELCATVGFALSRRPAAPTPSHKQVTPPGPSTPPVPTGARRPTKPRDLAELIQSLCDGKTSAAGCTVTDDGWLSASQRDLAAVLGVAAATVSREIKRLKDAGTLATRERGQGQDIKLINVT